MPSKPERAIDNTATDERLVRACLENDAAAWSALVDRYGPLVYSVAKRQRLPEDLCHDVFQEVFAILHRSLSALRDASGLAGFLATTTRREAWRAARTLQPQAGTFPNSEPSTGPPPDRALEQWEQRVRVDNALRTLGGRCERLLRALFTAPGTPNYRAISEQLGMPVGSIGPVRNRCLRKLLQLMEEDPD